jgi:hydrogenase maturation protease
MSTDAEILVLGIGNLLWADEGFGIRAVEALNDRYAFPPRVVLMDGGTQGLFLLPFVQRASRLLILDAIDFGLDPGALKVIRDDDVPQYMGAKKISMHQTGFQEVLESAAMLGCRPEHLTLIGVQPVELDDYGGSLRPAVKARIPEAIELAAGELRQWGVQPSLRTQAPDAHGRINPLAMDMDPYEAGRPQPFET